jgi:hypothetical protein
LEKFSVRSLKAYCAAYGIEINVFEKADLVQLVMSSQITERHELYFRQHVPAKLRDEFVDAGKRRSYRRRSHSERAASASSSRNHRQATPEPPTENIESYNLSDIFPNLANLNMDTLQALLRDTFGGTSENYSPIRPFDESGPPSTTPSSRTTAAPRGSTETTLPPVVPPTPLTTSTQQKHESNKASLPNDVLTVRDIIKNNIDPSMLSIKTLKLILSHNKVDYSGILEKSELVEKVEVLCRNVRKEMGNAPTILSRCMLILYLPDLIEKGNEEDLCRICLDGPLNCLILECAHLATCVDCAKLLKECPICRSHISRIIHVFKA